MSEQETDFLDELNPAVEPEQPKPETAKPEGEAAPVEKHDSSATTAPETPKEDKVPLAALMAERDKRQERERALAEAQRRIEELAKQQQPPGKPIWEDPDAYINQRVQQIVQPLQQGMYNAHLNALEAQAKEVHPDYDEKFAAVEEYCRENPGAGQQILAQQNPALAAYSFGKRLLELKAMGDPDAYRQKIEAEVRAKIKAEQDAEAEKRKQLAASLPPDLSSSRSVSTENAPAPEDFFNSLFEVKAQA